MSNGLAAKLADVKTSIREPEKSGTLNFADHDYWTRSDLFGAIRAELANRDIDWSPDSELVDLRPVDGGIMAVVKVTITFTDGETGEESTCSGIGQSISNDDKSVASATTQAIRFAITNKFQICDDMYEAMDTTVRQQNEGVHRESSDPNGFDQPLQALKGRLKGLDFSKSQTKEFLNYLARREESNTPPEMPEAALQKWADRLVNGPDEKVREKVMDKLD